MERGGEEDKGREWEQRTTNDGGKVVYKQTSVLFCFFKHYLSVHLMG